MRTHSRRIALGAAAIAVVLACGAGQAAADALCLQRAKDKFDGGTKGEAAGCFVKLEVKNDGPCVTFGDLAVQEVNEGSHV